MLTLLSPAKTLDYETPLPTRKHTQPRFLDAADELVGIMRAKTPADIAELMHLSPDLAELNHERYQDWHRPFDRTNARPAIFAFMGDVYRGLDAQRFDTRDLTHAQKHLRILSGLYGVLRPLDLMQPYRLEMGTKLANPAGDTLYDFWNGRIADALNRDLDGRRQRVVVNLASNEYVSAVDTGVLDARIVTPVFKDFSRGEHRVVSFFAKRARGLMAAWMITNRAASVRRLRDFDVEGYRYSAQHSTSDVPTFIRDPR